jgi:hypothetical protein
MSKNKKIVSLRGCRLKRAVVVKNKEVTHALCVSAYMFVNSATLNVLHHHLRIYS